MQRLVLLLCVCTAVWAASPKQEFKAGVARLNITPKGPVWMSGYAVRTKPSEAVISELFAKALVIEDAKKNKIVIVTTDLIGLPGGITDEVSARVEQQYGLRRSQLVFNSSHTHTGPVVWPNLSTMYFIDEGEKKRLQEYARKLTDDLFTVIGAAMGDMTAVSISFGQGEAGFAVNRRQFRAGSPTGPKGAIDHSVPVLELKTADGKRKAILFGYACHNTTLSGNHYQISGDYAGAAQSDIEKKYPGSTALFILLCAGDQNPNPRNKEELALVHGHELSESVGKVLESGELESVRGPIRTSLKVIDLAFAVHTREQFEQELKHKDKFRVARAKEMLADYDAGHPIRNISYPVQAIRFHEGFTLLALGGEVVVDYALRAKREYAKEKLVVAGYSNDVMCYIPSLRVLREGGYEGETSMIYYGKPGKFAEDVEDRIWAAIHLVMKRVQAKN